MPVSNSTFFEDATAYYGYVERDFYCKVPKGRNAKRYYEKLIHEQKIISTTLLLMSTMKKYCSEDNIFSQKFLLAFMREPEKVATIYDELKKELSVKHPHLLKQDTHYKINQRNAKFRLLWCAVIRDKNTADPILENLLTTLCRCGSLAFLDILLNNNLPLVRALTKNVHSLLHEAIHFKRLDVMECLFQAEAVTVNDDHFNYKGQISANGMSPLYSAIWMTLEMPAEKWIIKRGKKMAEMLLKYGANPDQHSLGFETPRAFCNRKKLLEQEAYTDFLDSVINADDVNYDCKIM